MKSRPNPRVIFVAFTLAMASAVSVIALFPTIVGIMLTSTTPLKPMKPAIHLISITRKA